MYRTEYGSTQKSLQETSTSTSYPFNTFSSSFRHGWTIHQSTTTVSHKFYVSIRSIPVFVMNGRFANPQPLLSHKFCVLIRSIPVFVMYGRCRGLIQFLGHNIKFICYLIKQIVDFSTCLRFTDAHHKDFLWMDDLASCTETSYSKCKIYFETS